jgi:hypothetical protein
MLRLVILAWRFHHDSAFGRGIMAAHHVRAKHLKGQK